MYWFKELSVQKGGEKQAFISFQSGLNLILGPSDTGKTLIFQCLDFLLGAGELPRACCYNWLPPLFNRREYGTMRA